MTRGGTPRDHDAPERRCIVSGERGGKAGLIRFAVSPEGVVVPDLAEKLPGRGMWLTADAALLAQAGRKGVFARAAKAPVTVPEDLPARVEGLLAARVVELLSLARKAGAAVCGFEKVKDWLAAGRAKVLLQAFDGSDRGKGKLWTPEGGRWFGCLSASEIGLAFGRDHAIHAALAPGGLTDKVIRDASRLTGLRGQGGVHAAERDSGTE